MPFASGSSSLALAPARPCPERARAAPLAFRQRRTDQGEIAHAVPVFAPGGALGAGAVAELGRELAGWLAAHAGSGSCDVVRNDPSVLSLHCASHMGYTGGMGVLHAFSGGGLGFFRTPGGLERMTLATLARGGDARALGSLWQGYDASSSASGEPASFFVVYGDALVFGPSLMTAGSLDDLAALPLATVRPLLACDDLLDVPVPPSASPDTAGPVTAASAPLAFAYVGLGDEWEIPRFVAPDAWGAPTAARLNADLEAWVAGQRSRTHGSMGRDCDVTVSTERLVSVSCVAPFDASGAPEMAMGFTYRLGPIPTRIRARELVARRPRAPADLAARCFRSLLVRRPDERFLPALPQLGPADLEAFALDDAGATFLVTLGYAYDDTDYRMPERELCRVPWAVLGTSLDGLATLATGT
ncbi:MAG: hypothetical protein IT373_30565 [Polyangiaceae bacterium]|nr:hypothetical protein [Polyangiaceae bacterium]